MKTFLGFLIILSLFMVYYDTKWYEGGIVPLPFISVVTVTLITFVYLMMLKSIKRRSIKVSKEYRVLLFFFLVFQLSFLGIIFNGPTNAKIMQYIKTSVHLLFYILFIFVIIELFSKHLLLKLLRFYYICGITAALFGIVQFIHLNLFRIPGIDQLLFGSRQLFSMGQYRIASVFNEPAWFSYFLLDWMLIGLVYIAVRRGKKEFIFLSILLIAFFCSASLGGFVVLSILIFLILSQFQVIQRRFYLIVAISLLPILLSPVMSQFFLDSIVRRIGHVTVGGSSSMDVRWDAAQATLQVWLRNPIVGVGTGNASFYTPEFYKGIWLDRVINPTAHIASDNVYTLILAENGAIGFIALIVMLWVFIKQQDVGLSKSMLNAQSLIYRKLWLFTRVFRIIVILNFIELFIIGGFLFPKIWFNLGVYLVLKQRLREERTIGNG